jgi:hypothetical protein
MGQAKLKGSFHQRKSAALANARVQFPSFVKCNNCGNELTEIDAMDVRGMPGMRVAGAAVCESCSHTTWTLDGTPEALAMMQDFLSTEHDGNVKHGFVKKPQS